MVLRLPKYFVAPSALEDLCSHQGKGLPVSFYILYYYVDFYFHDYAFVTHD